MRFQARKITGLKKKPLSKMNQCPISILVCVRWLCDGGIAIYWYYKIRVTVASNRKLSSLPPKKPQTHVCDELSAFWAEYQLFDGFKPIISILLKVFSLFLHKKRKIFHNHLEIRIFEFTCLL